MKDASFMVLLLLSPQFSEDPFKILGMWCGKFNVCPRGRMDEAQKTCMQHLTFGFKRRTSGSVDFVS